MQTETEEGGKQKSNVGSRVEHSRKTKAILCHRLSVYERFFLPENRNKMFGEIMFFNISHLLQYTHVSESQFQIHALNSRTKKQIQLWQEQQFPIHPVPMQT